MPEKRPKLTIKIPTSFVPPKKVDYEEEALAFLGANIATVIEHPGGNILPLPPPAGVFVLLEIADCKWVIDPSADLEDRICTIYIMAARENALPLAAESFRTGDRKPLLNAASEYVTRHLPEISGRIDLIYKNLVEYSQYGFEMVPPGGGQREAMWFSARWLANLCYLAGTHLSAPPFSAIWRIPLAMLGHIYAIHATANGEKHVERPPDVEALDRLVQEAEDREYAGELHPWQKLDPIGYPLTETQVAARFSIVEEFNEILKGKR